MRQQERRHNVTLKIPTTPECASDPVLTRKTHLQTQTTQSPTALHALLLYCIISLYFPRSTFFSFTFTTVTTPTLFFSSRKNRQILISLFFFFLSRFFPPFLHANHCNSQCWCEQLVCGVFLSLFFRFLLPLSLVLCKTSQRSTQNKYSIKQQVAFDTQTRCIHAHKPNHTLSCFFLFFSLFLSLVLTYITATLKQQHLHCNTPNNNCRVMKSDDRDRQNKNKNEKGTATFHMSSQMSVKHKLATRQLFLPGATRGKTHLSE